MSKFVIKIYLRVTSVICSFFTSSVGHYKKVTFYFVKKRCEGNKRNKYIITPCTLRYSLCLQIYQFLPFFFQKYFNSKYNLTTYFNRELSNNSIWTSTDIPNTCRDIIVLYVSDTWISNTWIFNILFCTWRPGPGTRLCDTDSDRSWHG